MFFLLDMQLHLSYIRVTQKGVSILLRKSPLERLQEESESLQVYEGGDDEAVDLYFEFALDRVRIMHESYTHLGSDLS